MIALGFGSLLSIGILAIKLSKAIKSIPFCVHTASFLSTHSAAHPNFSLATPIKSNPLCNLAIISGMELKSSPASWAHCLTSSTCNIKCFRADVRIHYLFIFTISAPAPWTRVAMSATITAATKDKTTIETSNFILRNHAKEIVQRPFILIPRTD